MAQFWRDQQVKNLSLSEEALAHFNTIFEARRASLATAAGVNDDKRPHLSYTLRFDGKGYRLFSITELLQHFAQATQVERVIMTLETLESLRSNRAVGDFVDLRLDAGDMNNCMLVVTSDDKDTVEATFANLQAALKKYQTRNGWARTAGTSFGVQIIGLLVGFLLSLWAAYRIAPAVTLENAFVITFILALLVFSNAWSYLNQWIIAAVHRLFPNIQFYRPAKNRLHWLMQAIVGGIATGLVLYALGWSFTYLGNLLKEFSSR